MIHSDTHPATVLRHVIDTVGDRLAQVFIYKIIHPNPLGRSLGLIVGFRIQGTSYLFFFPLPSRLEWVKNPAKHTLQPGNKPLLTQRPAGALMPTYQTASGSVMPDSSNDRQSFTRPRKGATFTRASSTPFTCAAALLHGYSSGFSTSLARTGLSSTSGYRQKIPVVHHKRGKPPLPQVTPPALPEVDEPSIPSVCLTKGPSETLLGFRHHHQVHSVGHKAVGPYLNPALGAPLCHHTDVRPVVILTKERRLSAVSPLRDRVR